MAKSAFSTVTSLQTKDDSSSGSPDLQIDRTNGSQKDETELELEKLVFGDSAGFRKALRDFRNEDSRLIERDAAEVTTGLEDLDDADLFFTDLTPGDDLHPSNLEIADDGGDDTLRSQYPPAWEDSDDERLLISLATVPRLRKLRRTQGEDMITGKDFSRRLRKQYELLNPVPEWALQALQMPATKKRRISEATESDQDESGDEMDEDGNIVSIAPLAKLLRDSESLVHPSSAAKGKERKLRPEVMDIQRQRDIPGIQPSAITSLSFHFGLPLLLSGGPSSTLYLHHLTQSPSTPTPNPLLTSFHLGGSNLTSIAFHPTDSRIFISGRRRYFHVWNLETGQVEKVARIYGHHREQKTMERFKLSPDGRFLALVGSTKKGGGVINLLDATTLQWTAQVRIESRGGIADFAWWRDSRGLCVVGKNGEVTEWDAADQRVAARWQDEGAVGTTVLALGGQHGLVRSAIGTDRWVAIGSSSGIVNVYDRRAWLSASKAGADAASTSPVAEHPSPVKTLDHLTTPTTHLCFSSDGQILAMASKWKRDAMRLVHLPSCTVFKNWPTSSTPLGRITGVAFAAGEIVEGGDLHSLLAVANEQGKIRLWEIR